MTAHGLIELAAQLRGWVLTNDGRIRRVCNRPYQECPLTAVANTLGEGYNTSQWVEAANVLGLPLADAKVIVYAADSTFIGKDEKMRIAYELRELMLTKFGLR